MKKRKKARFHIKKLSCFIITLIIILSITYQLYKHLFPSSNINPHGKYVLATGCSSDFGYALAIERDKQGFNVFPDICHLRSESLLKKHLSSRSIVFVLDITKQEEIDAAYNDHFLIVFVKKWLPGICVLILSNQVECEYLFSMDKKLLSEISGMNCHRIFKNDRVKIFSTNL